MPRPPASPRPASSRWSTTSLSRVRGLHQGTPALTASLFLMTIAWPAVYRDASGEIRFSLLNDGEHLSLTLRGIEFHGASLDDWALVEVDDPARLRSFTLHRGVLCAYTLTMAIPVPVVAGGVEKPAILEATLTLGGPAPSGRLDRENLKLAMDLD